MNGSSLEIATSCQTTTAADLGLDDGAGISRSSYSTQWLNFIPKVDGSPVGTDDPPSVNVG